MSLKVSYLNDQQNFTSISYLKHTDHQIIFKNRLITHSEGKNIYKYNPSCYNHKRKRALYFIKVQNGQFISFCETCKKMLKHQGFKCLNFLEYYRNLNYNSSSPDNNLFQQQKNKRNFNIILQKTKTLYEKVTNFRQQIESSQNHSFLTVEYVNSIFSKLNKQIQKMRQDCIFMVSSNIEASTFHKKQLQQRLIWYKEDIQIIVSRVTRNYKKMIQYGSEKFEIDLSKFKTDYTIIQNAFHQINFQYNSITQRQTQMINNMVEGLKNKYSTLLEQLTQCLNISSIEKIDDTAQHSQNQLKIINELNLPTNFY